MVKKREITEQEKDQSSFISLMDLFASLGSHGPDVRGRELICTPCGGNYGKVAYWLVCVNGSPPRGTLVIGQEHRGQLNDDIFYIDGLRMKKLGRATCRVVRRFESRWLSTAQFDFTMMSEASAFRIKAGRLEGLAPY